MSGRRATAADLAAFALHALAAERAGQFSEWGGVTWQNLAQHIENPRMELWAVEDAGRLRGYQHLTYSGMVDRMHLWRYSLAVIDPSLPLLLWSRLYLRSCREIARQHTGDIMEGSVVAGSTLDRLWQRYIVDWRTLREAPRTGGGMLTVAYYRGPADEFAQRLAAV